jgi:tetratricopeptide (TPR) repeat protein
MDLLEKLVDLLQTGNKVPLKHSLLIVSGIEDKAIGNDYLRKFGEIYHNFDVFARKKYGNAANIVKRAKALSEYLTTPLRYAIDKFLFNEVIDARLLSSPFVKHGNCMGLTCLYNALAEEDGIQTGIYKKRDHVFTRAFIDDKEYAIENTSPFGFDVRIESPIGVGFNLDLVAEVLATRRLSNFEESLRVLDFAKRISPKTSFIYFNSAVNYFNAGKMKQALGDINRAVEIDPFNPEGYRFRLEVKKALGDKEGAKKDKKRYKEVKKSNK